MHTDADECFAVLIRLAHDLDRGNHHATTFIELDVERTCLGVYDIDAVEDCFLAAANRIADRFGLFLFRLDVEDGVPSFFISYGLDSDDARRRLAIFVERQSIDNMDE